MRGAVIPRPAVLPLAKLSEQLVAPGTAGEGAAVDLVPRAS